MAPISGEQIASTLDGFSLGFQFGMVAGAAALYLAAVLYRMWRDR